jgi:hypothetical protein
MAVLAFMSSLERSLNLFNVAWSAPSRTMADRARLACLTQSRNSVGQYGALGVVV